MQSFQKGLVVCQSGNDLHVVEELQLVERSEGGVIERARQDNVLQEAEMKVLTNLLEHGGVIEGHHKLEARNITQKDAMTDLVAPQIGIVLQSAYNPATRGRGGGEGGRRAGLVRIG